MPVTQWSRERASMLIYAYTACLVTTSSLSYCMVYTLLVIINCVVIRIRVLRERSGRVPRTNCGVQFAISIIVACDKHTVKKKEQLISYWLCTTYVGWLLPSLTLLTVQSSTTHQQYVTLLNKLYTFMVQIDVQTLRPHMAMFYCIETHSCFFWILCLIGSVPAKCFRKWLHITRQMVKIFVI
jgi:hypothetical protein